MDDYNLKAANEWFIKTAAYLARDMGYDPEDTPTESQVERWREAVMKIITQHQAAHKRIESLTARVAELTELLRFAKCPDCGGSGAILHGPDLNGNWEAEQCQWCYEQGQLLPPETSEDE